jgi:hypothetical protein
MLQKACTGVDSHYLDVCQPAHQGNADANEKLVSIIFLRLRIICYLGSKLNILQDRYTEELKKIHRPELEDPKLLHYNVDVMYAANGGNPHGRYVKVSIIFH